MPREENATRLLEQEGKVNEQTANKLRDIINSRLVACTSPELDSEKADEILTEVAEKMAELCRHP